MARGEASSGSLHPAESSTVLEAGSGREKQPLLARGQRRGVFSVLPAEGPNPKTLAGSLPAVRTTGHGAVPGAVAAVRGAEAGQQTAPAGCGAQRGRRTGSGRLRAWRTQQRAAVGSSSRSSFLRRPRLDKSLQARQLGGTWVPATAAR